MTSLPNIATLLKPSSARATSWTKKFYVAIPFSSLELGISSNFKSLISINKKSPTPPKPQAEILARAALALSPKRDHLARLLARIGLRARQLTSPELIQFFFSSYHRSQVETKVTAASSIAPQVITVDFNTLKIDDWYFRSLFVAGYPRFVTANWLAPLINFDHSLNISMFVYPVESKSTLDDLRRKIAEMEAEISTDLQRGRVVDPSTQAKLEDALSLQDQLVKGAERFFQFGLYVTIPAKSESELNQVTKQVSSTLGSLLITTAPPFSNRPTVSKPLSLPVLTTSWSPATWTPLLWLLLFLLPPLNSPATKACCMDSTSTTAV